MAFWLHNLEVVSPETSSAGKAGPGAGGSPSAPHKTSSGFSILFQGVLGQADYGILFLAWQHPSPSQDVTVNCSMHSFPDTVSLQSKPCLLLLSACSG